MSSHNLSLNSIHPQQGEELDGLQPLDVEIVANQISQTQQHLEAETLAMRLAPYPSQTNPQLHQPFTTLAHPADQVPQQSGQGEAPVLEAADGPAHCNHHEPQENNLHNHHPKTRGLEPCEEAS